MDTNHIVPHSFPINYIWAVFLKKRIKDNPPQQHSRKICSSHRIRNLKVPLLTGKTNIVHPPPQKFDPLEAQTACKSTIGFLWEAQTLLGMNLSNTDLSHVETLLNFVKERLLLTFEKLFIPYMLLRMKKNSCFSLDPSSESFSRPDYKIFTEV